jgi:separase
MVTDNSGLGMVSHLLGLLGLVLVKVKLLDVTRRLCEQHSGTSHDGQWRYRSKTNNSFIVYLVGYITASVDLAHEYVKLGKTAKASTVYGQALIAIRNGGPSDEIRTTFLLRYAESLAIVNNVLRR